MGKLVNCSACGFAFNRRDARQKYCSKHCRKMQRRCADCGKQIGRAAFRCKKCAPRLRTDLRNIRDTNGRKRCPSCDRWLDEVMFSRSTSKGDGLQSCCKACAAVRRLSRKYGVDSLSIPDSCEICGGSNNGRLLYVDHDHACCQPNDAQKTCGECIRGFVCAKCNTRLAVLDDREWCGLAATYLDRYRRRLRGGVQRAS